MFFYSGYLDVLRGMGKPSTAATLHTHQPIDQDYVDVSMSKFMAAMDAVCSRIYEENKRVREYK